MAMSLRNLNRLAKAGKPRERNLAEGGGIAGDHF
jgi:hypothetical protein